MAALGVSSIAGLSAATPDLAAAPSAQLLADADRLSQSDPTPDPTLKATMEALRGSDPAGRSAIRTTTPAPVPTPTVAPIVGTFAPLPDCTARVPTAEPANGQLGDDELCSIGNGHRLRPDAAATYVAMDAAYTAAFGEPICITDSYRSYGAQQSLYWRKPGLAAAPGTSNHGWGLAVDLFCGVDDYSSPQHAWLVERGAEFGWFNPEWAQAGGSRPEPWHWEFDPALLG